MGETDKTAMWTKGLACLCGLLLLGLAAYNFVTFSSLNPINIILPVYYVIFGIFIIAAEFQITCLLNNFRMIQSFFGRGLFYIFVGTLCLRSNVFQYIAAGVLVVVGCIYMVWGCTVGRGNAVQEPLDPKK